MIDAEHLQELRELMADDWPDFKAQFATDTEQRLEQLRRLAQAGQWPELQQAAHSLKGSSSNLAMQSMCETCLQIEQAASDADRAVVEQRLQQLDTVWQESRQILQKF